MVKNKTLFVLVLVLLVNALSYGTIIPLLYPYASRFGIGPIGLSWLFASFSIAQFIATPIIGRLSDKYGRKPLLLICLLGTSISLALFASAQSVLMLFVSRILDGITGGNNSVAQAIIADSTTGPERAKAFGLLGAAFGFGFLLGPALGGILSQFGLTVPFWFASGLALLGTILGQVILKETLPPQKVKINNKPLFNFKSLYEALFAPLTGIILAISFLATLALQTFVLGFQTFTVDILRLSTTQIGFLFAAFGMAQIIMQAVGLRLLLANISSKKKILLGSLGLCVMAMFLMALTSSFLPFVATFVIYMFSSAPQLPILSALLSERTKAEDQGGVMGIQQSYISLGQIAGPLLGGAIAAISIHGVFFAAGVMFVFGIIATQWLREPERHRFDL